MHIGIQVVALVSISDVVLDALSDIYLIYGILGGKHGPLRQLSRLLTYSTIFELGYGVMLLRIAKDSYIDPAAAWSPLSFPCGCLAHARNPESSAWAGEKGGILRAAATRENDKQAIGGTRAVTIICRTQ
ncbi:MAG: hypothetical protein JOZ29_10160 [Deltaproteobacteria bacterium]|nr:hypothetical protein [Deltaproteobacteria bacterium]